MAESKEKLSEQIELLKYFMLFFNVFVWIIGACIFSLCMWLRFEGGLEEWIKKLDLESFYIGGYVLIVGAAVVMVSSVVGCLGTYSESKFLMLVFIGTQIFCFLCGLSGSSVLLDYSTQNSQIQPKIRESMRALIINSRHEESRQTLAVIQESIGCCGADGPIDYTSLHQPIPNQCRNTVTGNPFFHGCVDELSWFFEEKTSWITGLAMVMCLMHVVNAVLTIVLMQAVKKEMEASGVYN